MAKTLGQVAFEAHDARLEGATGYDWAYEPPLLREAWEAAAEAVAAATTAPNVVSGTIDTKTGNVRIHSPEELTARNKVIEAAKALHKRGSTLEEMDLIDEVDMAVEDLLAAEGEE